MPKVTLDRTIHAGGKVFFKGDAFVTDAEKVLIEAEIKRLEEIEAELESSEQGEAPKKGRAKSDK